MTTNIQFKQGDKNVNGKAVHLYDAEHQRQNQDTNEKVDLEHLEVNRKFSPLPS